MRAAACAAVCAAVLAGSTSTARAEERWLLSGEAAYLQALTEPQRDLFGPGLTGSLALHRSLIPWVAVGVRLRGGFLFDGDPPAESGRVNPGAGTLATLTGAVRIRPFARSDEHTRATGLWVEGAGGGGLTGDLGRGTFEVALGWSFPIGSVDLGPVARYVQIIDTKNELDDRDARLLIVGAELVLFDGRAPAPPPPPEPERPGDRDGDGLFDADDDCPDEPEDGDGFEDEDGCPDPDNDADGVLDVNDECPLEPEDRDGWQDEDGCPDPDNDGDGLADGEDRCPDEAEVVNGVDDWDGCPDEGVIELIDDRIVLEERVLFDKDRSKLKAGAREVLRAIVELWRQHPEWARLRVEGHADIRGEEDYNLDLSERRARVTKEKLIEFGIPEGIIEHKGFGSSRPRDLRRTEEAHQRNRRVEFVVVARHSDAPAGAAAAPGSEDGPQGEESQ